MDRRAGGSRTGLVIALCAAFVIVLALPFLLKPEAPVEAAPGGGEVRDAQKLVVVSPHWEGIRTEFTRAFSEWTVQKFGHRTEIDWLDMGGTSDALRWVQSEYERTPDGIKVDLFFGGGVDPYLALMKKQLLEPCDVPPDILGVIPQHTSGMEIYNADRLWFGACLGGFGILYNRKVLDHLGLEQPRSWDDMTRPQYFTWVGSGDPRSSGSVHMVYEIIAQAYGWDEGWGVIARMAGNIRGFSRAASQVPKDCALGEIACGMAIDVYARRQIAEAGTDRMGFVLPEGLTAVTPDAIGMLKGAPNRELAQEFVRFVLSEDGQKLWVLKRGVSGGPQRFELGRLSVIPAFAERFGDDAAVAGDPFQWIGAFTYDAPKGGKRWNPLNDLIGAWIIDTHEDLVAAWRTVKDLPPDDARVRELARPPLSEDEFMGVIVEKWGDAEFQTRTRAEWVREAQDRYRKIARGDK